MSERLAELLRETEPLSEGVAFETVARVRRRRHRGFAAGTTGALAVVLAATAVVATTRTSHHVAPTTNPVGPVVPVGVVSIPLPTGWTTSGGSCENDAPVNSVYLSDLEVAASCLPTGSTQPVITVRQDWLSDPLPGFTEEGESDTGRYSLVEPEGGHVERNGEPASLVSAVTNDPEDPRALAELWFPLAQTLVTARATTRAQALALLSNVTVTPERGLARLGTASQLTATARWPASIADPPLVQRSTIDAQQIDAVLADLRALPTVARSAGSCLWSGATTSTSLAVGDQEVAYADTSSCRVLIYDDGNAYGITPQLRADLAKLR